MHGLILLSMTVNSSSFPFNFEHVGKEVNSYVIFKFELESLLNDLITWIRKTSGIKLTQIRIKEQQCDTKIKIDLFD